MVAVVKLGTWGGNGGVAHDITVAPLRLESITVRWGKVLDSISFTYRDRDEQLHTAGPWGGTGGEKDDPDTVSGRSTCFFGPFVRQTCFFSFGLTCYYYMCLPTYRSPWAPRST
jgi:hypothetical protein